MKLLPLISVIVPVYKVETYLDKCIRSIAEQTYRNLEILLVDDGSPDSCGAICDGWAEKDSRIRVIHKENGGLSDARNAGMKQAKGVFTAFVDSDDWIEPEMFQLLYDKLLETGSDMAACGVQMDYEDGRESAALTLPGDYVFSTEEAMRELLNERGVLQPVWYKLYRTEQIRDLPFPVGKCHEDAYWTYQAVARAKRIAAFDTPCYHYLQRKNSIMGMGFSLKRLDALEAKYNFVLFCQSAFPSLEEQAKAELLFACIIAMQGSLRCLKGEDLKTARRIILDMKAKLGSVRIGGDCPGKRKALLKLAQCSLVGTAGLLNVLTDLHLLT